MKKHLSRVTSMLLAVFVAFSMVIGSTGAVFASSTWVVGPEEKTGFAGSTNVVYVYSSKSGKSATVKSVKSSNKKVIKVSKYYYYDDKNKKHTGYELLYKKAGKAKITVKYKTPSGKVKTAKKTITVKPYPNPIKSLKVNGKKVSTKKNQYFYDKKYKGTKAKIKVKLNKGWKIKSAYIDVYNNKTGKEIKGAKTKVKKGKKKREGGT